MTDSPEATEIAARCARAVSDRMYRQNGHISLDDLESMVLVAIGDMGRLNTGMDGGESDRVAEAKGKLDELIKKLKKLRTRDEMEQDLK